MRLALQLKKGGWRFIPGREAARLLIGTLGMEKARDTWARIADGEKVWTGGKCRGSEFIAVTLYG